MSHAVPVLRFLTVISLVSCTNEAPGPRIIVESAGLVPPTAADTQQLDLVAAITRPRVRLEPVDLSTNVDQHALSLWVESEQFLGADLLDELRATARLVKLPERAPVPFTLQTLIDDPRRGANAMAVDIASTLDAGWYELAAGPLPSSLEWGPAAGLSYELSDDGTATVRFRIGSEPRATNVFYCNTIRDGAHVQKVYMNLSEIARITRPVAEHVSMETQRGPVACSIPIDDNPDHTSTGFQLNVTCSDISLGDMLTIVLSDAFTPLSDPEQPTPGANETLSFRVGDFTYENPTDCGYHKLGDSLVAAPRL